MKPFSYAPTGTQYRQGVPNKVASKLRQGLGEGVVPCFFHGFWKQSRSPTQLDKRPNILTVFETRVLELEHVQSQSLLTPTSRSQRKENAVRSRQWVYSVMRH